MSKHLRVALLIFLSAPVIANAAGHFHGGIGYRYGFHGPVGYYHGPRYGYYGYYGPAYYGYYAPGYYYAPPATVYAEPEVTVDQPPANYWYYCAAAKAYYPYVTSCPSGWEAVPAQAPQQQNSQAAAPTRIVAAPPKAGGPAGSVVYRFGDLLFSSGKAGLQPVAQGSLAAMLAAIKKEPTHHITIEGHTDSSGDAAANLELSQRRAEAVKQFLIERGVPADHIDAIGKGSDAPIADNNTPEGRKLNRRVDVIVG